MGKDERTLGVSWINAQIPAAIGRHRVTSNATDTYNCVAWAAEDDTDWWSYLPGYKWTATRSPLVSSLIEVFERLGYSVVSRKKEPGALEPGVEKVVIYARGGQWTHIARQLPTGKWTCKLGPDEDIEHDNPECLTGHYGPIHCFMRRTVSNG